MGWIVKALVVVGIWFLLSIPVAVLVGRLIRAGRGHDPPPPPPHL